MDIANRGHCRDQNRQDPELSRHLLSCGGQGSVTAHKWMKQRTGVCQVVIHAIETHKAGKRVREGRIQEEMCYLHSGQRRHPCKGDIWAKICKSGGHFLERKLIWMAGNRRPKKCSILYLEGQHKGNKTFTSPTSLSFQVSSILITANAYWILITCHALPKHFI